MNKVKEILAKIQAAHAKAAEATGTFDKQYGIKSEIAPEDETTPAKNIRNFAVEKLGLPVEWKISAADEKRFYDDAAKNMASGAMGTVTPGTLFKGVKASNIVSKMVPKVDKTVEAAKKAEVAQVAAKLNGVPVFDKRPMMADKQRSYLETLGVLGAKPVKP